MDAQATSRTRPRKWRRRGSRRRRPVRLAWKPLLALGTGLALLALIVVLAAGGGSSEGAFARAEAAAAAGDMRTARVEAMNAVEAEPGNPAAWRLLARSQIALGDMQAALTTTYRARNAGIAPGMLRDLTAEAALGTGDGARALEESAAADVAPAFRAEVARVRGLALFHAGDGAGAATAFDESIALDADNPRLWRDIAIFRRDSGDLAGAIEAADHALELAPDLPSVLLLKGRLARSQYGPAASLGWFDRAVEIDPLAIGARLERAATLGDLGRMQAMLADTRAVLERDPENANALYLQAVLAARAREDAIARHLIEVIGGALDWMPGMQLLEAALDLRSANYEAAISRLEALLAEQPTNRAARRLLGAARFGAGDMRAAHRALEPLLSRPDAGSYELILGGRAEERLGNFDAAYRLLERAAAPRRRPGEALGAAPDAAQLAVLEAAARSGAAGEQVALIRAYLALGRTGDALALAARLQAENPGAPDAHILYGDVLAQQGRVAAAAEAYSRAANIRFTAPVVLRLVEALEGAGAGEEAARALALYRAQNPRELSTALLSAQRNLAAGRWRAAAAILERVRARIGDRDAAVLANLAWARHELGDREAARALARRAYRLMPASPAVTRIYGRVSFAAGARGLGIELLEKARALDPADPLTRWQLGRAYAALDRDEEARAEIEAALAADRFGARGAAEALLARL